MVKEHSLVSLVDVKSFLAMKGSVADTDTLLEKLIDSVSTLFESYLNRNILSREYIEYHDGRGLTVLFPYQPHITTVSGIWNDSDWSWNTNTLVPDSIYRVVDNSFIMFHNTTMGDYSQNVKIIYSAGYETTPDDLKQSTITEVARIYKNKDNVSVNTRFSKTESDGSTSFASDNLLPQTLLTLNRYKRITVL